MSNQITTQTISFHGSDLITLKVEDIIYTAVRPIVEAMGLDWGGQQQKLSKSGNKFGCRDISMPTNGGLQKMICMPIKKLNGWLFSINPEKVRSDLKEKVICYQEECFEALYNYWHFGKAEKQTFAPIDQSAIEADEEALYIIVNLFHSLNGAHEMGNKIRKEHPYLAKEIDKTIGGHYIYNLNGPTENALAKARKYIHAKSERIMFVKGMLSLLEEPKRRLGDF
ncbi:phage antirepressor N-terminal domain-containing protein [Actinobacillus seminis]|uniref:phage antirepressor N-terminal domain-containing protein n=1 Tax=Actinobacillus seminis TaxID=722 RepID=UPI003B93037B